VVVGDEKGLVIPEWRAYPLGRRAVRGLRLIHTHFRNEHFSEDDVTVLGVLGLDRVGGRLCS
jgi:GTP-binding protein HflX